ncbi:MAG: glycosyltransferase family 2 protein [Anaerolineae bacterium]
MSYLDSALDKSARARLSGTGPVDIVVGLPTYKNSRTIAGVISALSEGLSSHFADHRALIVVSDGGSTDDTVPIARRAALPRNVSLFAHEYRGVTGKGSAIRAVLEVASELDAHTCAIVDADLRSITPEWIERLVGPVLGAGADFVSPRYTRDRHEVTINDMIAYPLTRALYGFDIRQPLGGEIAMSRRAYETFVSRDVWETDVARFGVHIWMITLAVNSGWRMYEAPLGTKTHDYKDPTVGFEPKFMQIVGTMFRLMSIYRRVWPEVAGSRAVPLWGKREHLDPEPVPTTRKTLWDGFQKGMKRYRRIVGTIVSDDKLAVLDELRDGKRPPLPAEMWAEMVMDFAVVYNRGEGDPDKVALSLLPVYYARKASLLRSLEGEPWTAVEDAIKKQADAFLEHKEYLVDRWVSYLPWRAPVS